MTITILNKDLYTWKKLKTNKKKKKNAMRIKGNQENLVSWKTKIMKI